MKAVTELQWAFVVLLPTFVLLAFVASPMEALIDKNIENNARFIALDIAASINLVQASVDGTSHEINLPNVECKIEIHEHFVRVHTTGAVETEADVDILMEPLIVQTSEHDCIARVLTIIRDGNIIKVIS